MASICFDLMTQKLLNIKEIFGRLDPIRFSEVMEDGMLLIMDAIINEVAEEYMGDTWNNLPKNVRDDVVITAESESSEFMAAFMVRCSGHQSARNKNVPIFLVINTFVVSCRSICRLILTMSWTSRPCA